MLELLQYVVKSLVHQPDKVKIEESNEKDIIIFSVFVDDSDLGQLIGKEGSTAKAIRTLVRSMGKSHEKVAIKFYAL
ncbi:MAG: KH domain-containing protein [Clostridia bacterium]|nr:KH domain-containing protein [Clostridia bacterium]